MVPKLIHIIFSIAIAAAVLLVAPAGITTNFILPRDIGGTCAVTGDPLQDTFGCSPATSKLTWAWRLGNRPTEEAQKAERFTDVKVVYAIDQMDSALGVVAAASVGLTTYFVTKRLMRARYS